jgi:hypothetical protein
MNDLYGCNCKSDTWSATLDMMPPQPNTLRVAGICACPTGGFKARLAKAQPQGVNARELILNLIVDAPSGIVNQMITDYPVEYTEHSADYDAVRIMPCNISINIETVH